MRIRSVPAALAVAAAISLTLAGCGKKEEPPQPQTAPPPVSMPAPPVAATATETFAPADTLYASVDTTGSGTATLAAKWTYHMGEQVAVVKEDTMTVTTTGPATHEFHVSKPDGWPAGDYQVEITLNGQPALARKLVVR